MLTYLSSLIVALSMASATPHSVTRYASPNPGSVNSWIVRGPEGLVIIDSSRNVRGGRHVVARARQQHEPVQALLITHSHPDHIGGLGVLHRAFPNAPILASRATAYEMRVDPQHLYRLARQADPNFPGRITLPTGTFRDDATLHIAGLTFQTDNFVDGESAAATIYYVASRRLLFGGDLTANHMTPALIEGHTCGWLQNLELLTRRFPRARSIDPGHGAQAPAAAQITRMRSYLRRARALVAPAVAPDSPDGVRVAPAEMASILGVLRRRYRHYPRVASVKDLAQLNITAVAAELLRGRGHQLPEVCR